MCETRLRNGSDIHDNETIGRAQEFGVQKGDGCRCRLRGPFRHRRNQKRRDTIMVVGEGSRAFMDMPDM